MKLINDRAHEVVDKACENLVQWPNDFIDQEDLVMLIHGAIEEAVEEARAEQVPVTAKAEREECLKILQKVYQEWVDGDWAPGEAFESAKERIRFRGQD